MPPPPMPTLTTKIIVPHIEDPYGTRATREGALAAAKQDADGHIRLAVDTILDGVALADLTEGTATASLAPGSISPSGYGAYYRRKGDQLYLVSLDGDEIAVPPSLDLRDDSSWTFLANGAVVVEVGTGLHFVKDGATVWSVRETDERYVGGHAVSADLKTVYVSLPKLDKLWAGHPSGSVMAVGLDGKQLWRKDLPEAPGRVVASRGGAAEIAVVTNPDSYAQRAAIILDAATGEIRRRIRLPSSSPPFSYTDDSNVASSITSSGFSNGLLWFYTWIRERSDHMTGVKVHEECKYAVYDTNQRDNPLVRSNTLLCVRAMIPLDDGRVVTVERSGETSITARVYDTVP